MRTGLRAQSTRSGCCILENTRRERPCCTWIKLIPACRQPDCRGATRRITDVVEICLACLCIPYKRQLFPGPGSSRKQAGMRSRFKMEQFSRRMPKAVMRHRTKLVRQMCAIKPSLAVARRDRQTAKRIAVLSGRRSCPATSEAKGMCAAARRSRGRHGMYAWKVRNISQDIGSTN